ncbi:hypothetical protein ACHAPV_002982 [Trichoderma viride]
MKLTSNSLAALAAASAIPFATGTSSTGDGPDKNGKYWIRAKGIEASFIPYGASISNLFINDRYGVQRDLVGGFDNATYYGIDKQHPHFGGVPGRYANRIKNSTFTIDGKAYHVLPNENPTKAAPNGSDTLHGGPDGWDWRNFTVTAYSPTSITFSITDPDGKEGFPGEVVSHITYTVKENQWDFVMVAQATTKKTPIMLSSHTYWNLDGFANNQTQTALNHTLHLPYGGQRVDVDGFLIPTGDIVANKKDTANDFWSEPKQLGKGFQQSGIKENCGNNCTGFDTCYLTNRGALGNFDWRTEGPVASLSSPWSGIHLDVYSDQDAFQVYTCNGQNGSMALKTTQGLHNNKKFPRTIPQYGCLVMEVEDWIDGINNPEWGRKQIWGPGDAPYVVQASYRFSIDK